MDMYSYAHEEMKKLEKQIAGDNRKLDALRMVIREYATVKHPGAERLNALIMECLNKHNGQATFAQLAEYISAHQIILPRNELSSLLTRNSGIEYDKNEKIWKIAITLPDTNKL